MFVVTRQTVMTPTIVVYLKAFASVRIAPAATSTAAFHESLSTTQRLSLNGGSQGSFLVCGNICWGPSIKYVTLEGGGVREGVTVCDRGRGSRAFDVTLIQIFIIRMKHEI